MKKFVNKILDSKSFKVAMINMLFSNPGLRSADYLRLNEMIRELNQNQEMPKKVQLKKVS